MAGYYGVLIDPCRVTTPIDEGKVERIIPVARELFRRLENIYPMADLISLNKEDKMNEKDELIANLKRLKLPGILYNLDLRIKEAGENEWGAWSF